METVAYIITIGAVSCWFGHLMRQDHAQAMEMLEEHADWVRRLFDSDQEPEAVDEADWWKNPDSEDVE